MITLLYKIIDKLDNIQKQIDDMMIASKKQVSFDEAKQVHVPFDKKHKERAIISGEVSRKHFEKNKKLCK